MNGIIEVENYLDVDWKRVLHLMSNERIEPAEIVNPFWVVPDYAEVSHSVEVGLHHMRASWEAREAFAGTMYGGDRRERQVVVWGMRRGERVSEAVREAGKLFCKVWGRLPGFAAVGRYPLGAEDDCEIEIEGGCVALVECKDVRVGFVMLF